MVDEAKGFANTPFFHHSSIPIFLFLFTYDTFFVPLVATKISRSFYRTRHGVADQMLISS